MNMKQSLLEILGIEGVGPAGALQRALVFEDEVCPGFHQDEVTDRMFIGEPHQTTSEISKVRDGA